MSPKDCTTVKVAGEISTAEAKRRFQQRLAMMRALEARPCGPHPLQCLRSAFWLALGFWLGIGLAVWGVRSCSAPPSQSAEVSK